MMVAFLEKGGHIQIIHNISRNIDEMLFALKVWTPLYLSGRITSYFYPRIRDNVFFRTLFIAPGVAAVLSASTVAPTEDNMCFLLNDAAAISSAEKEMRQLMTQRRPLMSYYRPFEARQFHAALQSLKSAKEDTLIFSMDACCFFLPSDLLLLSEEADRLSKKYPNLHILSLPVEAFTMDAWITESHAMIGTQMPSPLIFSIKEPRLVGALWEHFERLTAAGGSAIS